jgi:hypothetical protein
MQTLCFGAGGNVFVKVFENLLHLVICFEDEQKFEALLRVFCCLGDDLNVPDGKRSLRIGWTVEFEEMFDCN